MATFRRQALQKHEEYAKLEGFSKPTHFKVDEERHVVTLQLTQALINFGQPERIPLRNGRIEGSTDDIFQYYDRDQKKIVKQQTNGILKAIEKSREFKV